MADSSHAFGSDVFITSTKEDSADQFSENVNVAIQDLPGDTMTLDTYVNISVQQIQHLANNYEIAKSLRMSRDGTSFHWIIVYHTQGIYRLRTEQYYFIKGAKAFVVTYSAEASKEAMYKDVASKIMESFRLSPAAIRNRHCRLRQENSWSAAIVSKYAVL